MKNLVVNYDLLNEKVNKNIIVISDLHGYPKDNKDKLAESIKNENPELIIIAGDMMDGIKYKEKKHLEGLRYFLSELSENCPVFLEKGNHDLIGYDQEAHKNYKKLETARKGMIYPLDNESVVYDNVRITGVCPGRDAFKPSYEESGKGVMQFVNDVQTTIDNIPIDNKYSILICHSPRLFAHAFCISDHLKFDLTEEQLKRLIDFSGKLDRLDMVASGHLHNGYIPVEKVLNNPEKYMDYGYTEMPIERTIDNKIEKIRPIIYKKVDMCRGVLYVGKEFKIITLSNGNQYLKNDDVESYSKIKLNNHKDFIPVVISGGINKYFGLPISSSEITKVKIKKK